MNLYLLQYNNYYNRILKRENSLDDYREYSSYAILGIKNFSYADGVSTSQTATFPDEVILEYGLPDYAVAVDDNDDIVGRYFVIDAVYQCKNQYVLTLYRDLVADYYEEVMKAPIFVEKGNLNGTDPFIFNKENMTFNQIKTSERLLQDKFATPWIIGYMGTANPTTDTEEAFVSGDGSWKFTFKRKLQPHYTITNKSQFESVAGVPLGATRSALQEWGYKVAGNVRVPAHATQTQLRHFDFSFNSRGSLPVDYPQGTVYGYEVSATAGVSEQPLFMNRPTATQTQQVLDAYISSIGGYAENQLLIENTMGIEGEDKWLQAINEKDKIVYVSSEGKYYQVVVDSKVVWGTYDVAVETDIWQKLKQVSQDIVDNTQTALTKIDGLGYNNDSFKYTAKFKRATLSLKEYEGVPVEPKEITIPKGRNILQDAPYCMFAIPYNDNRRFYKNDIYQFGTMGPEIALNFVSDMSTGLTGANVLWDIQLLPYSPFQSRIMGSEGIMDITGMAENADYQFIEIDEESHTGIPIFWCQQSTFSFNIGYEADNPYQRVEFAGTVIREGKPWPEKIWNEVATYRLCSPNYSSQFEFSPAKNNGVSYFNVDCSYKPFQPYIHINPNFGGLYGEDFNDARGLICSGDFSLPQISDAWETYQRQNINYLDVFDRQIENMETTQGLQREQEFWQAFLGSVSGAISGAMTGSLASGGNPVAGIAGGILGGGLSALAGAKDISINNKLRAEALDYTRDNFGYSLGNIQALPTTISKVSAFTANNKIYPVLEIYLPTDQEVEALCYKLGYNGMTVMRIDTMENFILSKTDAGKYAPAGKNYFKGKLVMMEDIAEDFHIINALSAELDKGVFI